VNDIDYYYGNNQQEKIVSSNWNWVKPRRICWLRLIFLYANTTSMKTTDYNEDKGVNL
jgi:hypothetical protein